METATEAIFIRKVRQMRTEFTEPKTKSISPQLQLYVSQSHFISHNCKFVSQLKLISRECVSGFLYILFPSYFFLTF